MTIKIAKFAKTFNQSKTFTLVYQNQNTRVYSIKLPFRYFICLTLNTKQNELR